MSITNFRNFQHLDISLDDNAVFVGENKVGKSNLLHALRLVLDPSLPDIARQLRPEDFWDGLPRPLGPADAISITVELAGFDNNDNQLALLADCLVEVEPFVARLTYVFRPTDAFGEGGGNEADYEFFLYGGERVDNKLPYEVRRRLPLTVLPALRDTEADLANWRRSPLRPLLEGAVRQLSSADLREVRDRISGATDLFLGAEGISDVAAALAEEIARIAGSERGAEASLGLATKDPARLIRELRVLIDDGARGVEDASLGTSNIIYLALKLLEVAQDQRLNNRDHTFLGIEEPEAHLHPHMQRLVYRRILRSRGASSHQSRAPLEQTTLLLTSHSPHVASVAPLRSMVVLKTEGSPRASIGSSAAKLDLSEREIDDVERYLDVTRGEMLFAKAVILAEGESEAYVLPALAHLLGIDFDGLGITVCVVAGTHFEAYLKLLSPDALNIPTVVLTDMDPTPQGAQAESRVRRLLSVVDPSNDYSEVPDWRAAAAVHGIFVNDWTLEVDLFRSGQHHAICTALTDLGTASAAKRAKAWAKDPADVDVAGLLADISTIGKGRFAQRLAGTLAGSDMPISIEKAIRHAVASAQSL